MPTKAALMGLHVAVAVACLLAAERARACTIIVDNKSNPTTIGGWTAPERNIGVKAEWTYDSTCFYPTRTPQWWPCTKSAGISADLPNTSFTSEASSYVVANTSCSRIRYVEVYTNLDNMYGVDQVVLQNSDGTTYREFGVDNMNAWCISTDPNDGYTADCNGNPAERLLRLWNN